MKAPKHPAPFSPEILAVLERLVRDEWRAQRRKLTVLDPFAGIGRIHRLADPLRVDTIGVELEPEWAATHERTICADSICWMERRAMPVDVVATSVDYGNRFADRHEARDGSRRRSYKHDLGRELSEASIVAPWGPRYWHGHARAYRAMLRVLRPGGLLLLNVSNFVRSDREVHAVEWHMGALAGAGFIHVQLPVKVPTRRMRDGANHKARVDGEVILRYRRPT